MFTGTMPILSLVTPLTLHLVSDGTYLNVFLHSKHYPWVIRLKAWCKMQIDPRFPPRLSLSDTFWLQVANIFRFPKIFIWLIRPSIWMMLILIVFSPITAPCAECLVGTIISRTIESHLPCFDKSTSCDTRQMAPSPPHCTCHLLWLTSLDPAHMVTGVNQRACALMTLNISSQIILKKISNAFKCFVI